MRVFLLLGFYLSSLAAFGQSAKPLDTRSTYFVSYTIEQLRDYILAETPQETGLFELFYLMKSNPKLRLELDQLMASDPKLLAFADRGKEFWTRYRQLLAEDFGEERVAFALAPEEEILRRSRATDFAAKLDRQESTRLHIEAEKLALHDTRTTFALPHSFDVSDIEKNRYTARNGEVAYQYFKRQYNRYMVLPVERLQPARDNVRKFKIQMVEVLEELKEKNFLRFLERVKAFTREYSLTINANKIYDLKGSQIKSIKLDFSNHEHLAIQDKIEKVKPKRSWWYRILLNDSIDSWRKKDVDAAGNVYEVPAIHPNVTKKTVHFDIELKTGEVIALDLNEADFSHWLNSVKPGEYFGSEKEDHILRQYVIEAASRNAIYTNLISYLMETPSRNLADFQVDLQRRINQSKSEDSLDKQTLSEQIRAQSESLNIDSKVLSAMWTGFAVHPDYWSIRAAIAKDFAKAQANDKVKKIKFSKETNKIKKSEKDRKEFRYISSGGRLSFHVKRLGKRFAKAVGAMALAGTLWYGQILIDKPSLSLDWLANVYEYISSIDMPDLNIPDMNLPDFELPKFDLGFNFDPSFFKLDDAKITNHQLDGKESNSSAEAGKKNKGVIYFLLAKRIENSQLPKTYDVLAKANLPKEILEDKNSRSEPESAKRLSISGASSENDFSVVTNVIHKPIAGRVPIAAPDHSKIVGLEVKTKNNVLLKEGQDYKVYQLKTNHLLWIELSEKFKHSQILYKADYILVNQASEVSAEMVNWQSMYLSPVNYKLHSAGMWSLSKAIGNVVSESSKVSATQIQDTFVVNATYTYSSKMWSVRGEDRQNPFRPLTKFVNEQGDLIYQCTGSNMLFTTFANQYYKMAGLQYRYKAENLTAWVRIDEKPIVTFKGGHLRSILFNLKGQEDYRILDATPRGDQDRIGSDSNDKDMYQYDDIFEKDNPNSQSNKVEIDQYWIRSEQIKLPKPSVQETAPPEEKPEEDEILVVTETNDQDLLLKKLRELIGLRSRMKQWIRNLAQDDLSVQRNFGKVETPGLQIFVYSRLVEDYVLSRINQKEFLARYLSVSWVYPQPAYSELQYLKNAEAKIQELQKQGKTLNQIVHLLTKQTLEQFKTQIQYMQNANLETKESAVEFVLDEEYQYLLKNISVLISSTQWSQLDEAHRSQFLNNCARFLSGGAQ